MAGMTIHQVHGAWGRGSLTTVGGCVLSWAPSGRGEVLWMAEEAQPQIGWMWHGGIPVCAPWFGTGRGEFPAPYPHGLVARAPWVLDLLEQSDNGARAVLTVEPAAIEHLPGAELYPPDLGYRLDVHMDRHRLTAALEVSSPTRDVVVDVALHPYFAVDARRASVEGLEGVPFRDFAADARPTSEHAPIALGRHVDRVYVGAPAVTLSDPAGSMRLSADGASNVIVWNPGPGGSQVSGDQWSEFVCVEYGCVQGDAVSIPAGGRHTVAMHVEV